MNDLTLHYLYDPLCGWCYGASPLLAAAREVTGLDVRLHGGGMMTDANRQPVGAGLRHYVMPHDLRIAQLTGQPFGKDYCDGLLRDTSAVFDSAPPTAAVLAAEALDGLGAAMLARIQRAHYVEGRRIAERPVLLELGAELGLGEGFAEAFDACSGEPLRAHFADSRRLMNRLGAAGFPTFALERDGRLQVLDTGRYLGQPDDWRALLETQLRLAGGSDAVGGAAAPLCRIDGCA
ncbi:DsbA family protein [Pseudomonas aeruginosa]|uniref:disulfide reductase DsbM n=1 Tax=Pseudomonas aeruginosa TaxID=287 RepID=UPI0003BAF5D6|nr:disulfide reductase DsbM [Pseudomonas aeruginosa]HCL2783315.1 DsbA family protein [Pseudomonas aeruginosa AC9A]AHC74173.1 Thioredoxin-like protein clustered [Pseudomonas aeruginosa SCV20265]EKQ5879413.1 DsbA family protein [Pseudomonas aeruginosa]EKW2601313.1 DsbA family protein [Pseudomonas aeruginosa]EKY0302208.1 DsbA family protein [Pseudomonas aeruginosa]